MKFIERFDKVLVRQVVLYGIIGGGSALLDFLLFTLFVRGFGLNEYLANAFSIHAGIAMSFLLNSRFNFKKTDRAFFRATSFYLTGLFGLALSQGILWFGMFLSVDVLLTKFISIFFVAAVQFTINKFVTFNR